LKLTNLKDKVVGTVNEIKTSLTGLKDFYGIVFIQISDKVKIGIDNVIKTLKEKTSELTSSLIALKEAFTISGVNDEIDKFVGNLEKIPEKLNAMIPAIIKFSTIFKDFTFLMVHLLQLMENQALSLAEAIRQLRQEALALGGLVEYLTQTILGIYKSIKESEEIRNIFKGENLGNYQAEWDKMAKLYEKLPYLPVPPPPTPPGMPGHQWETEGLEQIIINGDLNISGVQNVEELMNKIKRQSSVRGNVYVG